MVKRKMPAHIVLPNGMWRFVKRGRSSSKTVKRMAKGYRRRGRFSRAYSRHAPRAKNILMKGFFGSRIPFGLLGLVGAGFLYSKFLSPSVPKVIPMQSALTESAVIGGLPMAIGSYLSGSINLGSGSMPMY